MRFWATCLSALALGRAAFAVSNNLTTDVTWDPFSLSILGQRIFLHSGEFHPWRLPSRSLWKDIMQKAAAGGLNGVSLYAHLGLMNPAPGVLDFDGLRSMEDAILEAQAAGLWVTARIGPYVNGETTGGGLPGWMMSLNATLRTNDATYTQAWTPYWTAMAKILAKHQITAGGPVILVQVENEFDNVRTTPATYMVLLEQSLRSNGVVVPTTHNNKGLRDITYAAGTGAVDIWGIDSYPGNGCASSWSAVVTNYNDFKNTSGNPTLPLYSPEFVGGWFDPWGSTGNYAACRAKIGPEFERVFYEALWAQNAKMINFYMYYGGTNWGGLAAPVVYTSYDYGAAIPENRVIGDKFNELKLLGLFIRSARDFRQTSFAPEVTTLTSSADVTTAEMRNAQTGATFYLLRHTTSQSTATVSTTLKITTKDGAFTIPQTSGSQITLLGHDSRAIVADYQFGATRVLYSTAAVLLGTTIDGVDWLVVHGYPQADAGYEVVFAGVTGRLHDDDSQYYCESPTSSPPFGALLMHDSICQAGLLANFRITAGGRALLSVGSVRLLALDTTVARTFWAPVLPASSGTFKQFAEVGSNATIIVAGPALVRTAAITNKVLALTGDTNRTTTLQVYGGSNLFSSVTWNGAQVSGGLDTIGAWSATLDGPSSAALSFVPPTLAAWKFKDSLPEISTTYNDSRWVTASKTSTFLTMPAYPRDTSALLGEQDYGFFTGNVLFRGHFTSTGKETGVFLGINGGQAFAASAWLNGVYLGSTTSFNSTDSDVKNVTLSFPSGALRSGDNVVTVLKDNMGLNEWSGPSGIKQARGIVGFQVQGGANSTWKIQGNFGGNTNFPDKVRGSLNEGGLFAERAGWHLPGFDDSTWESRTPVQGLTKPGVGFFRTTFDLSVPSGHDVAMSFVFRGGGATRVQLYVNGWQMGKYVANLGPQTVFPVHEGILDYHGKNTVAVSLWAVGNSTTDFAISDLQLKVDAVLRGGVIVQVANPVWSARDVF
ncbi:hypothetical protein EXIGLDRAFT_813087 [Exidia glandulosa HHB12029]|uniref:Beta-galactosidase n=1 Tax=Exidia glandulosa HHB12029 TaxID=1314781 RepID=A0A165PW94_EXIGL|nr:hypothetical protein EXIGLDRAFT_813087 [Exidia glandulosa HHB12029]